MVKVIHGYGSTGKGGAIRTAIREQMAEWQRAGKVLRVVPGENWSIFDAASQDLRQQQYRVAARSIMSAVSCLST